MRLKRQFHPGQSKGERAEDDERYRAGSLGACSINSTPSLSSINIPVPFFVRLETQGRRLGSQQWL